MSTPSSTPPVVGLLVAGGRGSRLGGALPKPLVRVAGRELIARNLERLTRADITEIHVSLGPGGEEIRTALQSLAGRTVDWHWHGETEPRGTLGSLAQLAGRDATLIAVNADLFTTLDLAPLLAHHRSARADLTCLDLCGRALSPTPCAWALGVRSPRSRASI